MSAPNPSDEDWNRHQHEIWMLYIKQDMSRMELMRTMEERHGFVARFVDEFDFICLASLTQL
ncbi:hypothetical protein GQ53DRAFT_743091 [Thozetella sp. PMI_491]|nr:hypothetical protein GQ53DRAFT_743091 [Thozetella sp. PMI_491]